MDSGHRGLRASGFRPQSRTMSDKSSQASDFPLPSKDSYFKAWAQRPCYVRLLGYFDAKGSLSPEPRNGKALRRRENPMPNPRPLL